MIKKFTIICLLSSAYLLVQTAQAYAGCYDHVTILSQEIEVEPALDCLSIELEGDVCDEHVNLSMRNQCEHPVSLTLLSPDCGTGEGEDYRRPQCDEPVELIPEAQSDVDAGPGEEAADASQPEEGYPQTIWSFSAAEEGGLIQIEALYQEEAHEVSVSFTSETEHADGHCGCMAQGGSPLSPVAPSR